MKYRCIYVRRGGGDFVAFGLFAFQGLLNIYDRLSIQFDWMVGVNVTLQIDFPLHLVKCPQKVFVKNLLLKSFEGDWTNILSFTLE